MRPVYPTLTSDTPLTPGDSRISVGYTATPAQFPWMTLVSMPNSICGGVLIAPNAVLTAAHCIVDYQASSILNFGRLYIGLTDLNTCQGCDVRRIKEYYINPTFNAGCFGAGAVCEVQGDIALLILDTNSTKTPGTIPEVRPLPGQVTTVIGWGKTAATQAVSPTLQ